jgi:hypothetical protein
MRLAAGLSCVLACACGGTTTSPTQPHAASATITFNDIPGATQYARFAIARESGYVITPSTGLWQIITSYGRPGPSVQFFRPWAGDEVTAEVSITANGAAFRLQSVDLYSSTTTIPYTFTGTHGTAIVFTVSAVLPSTAGNFVTVANPKADQVIDGLVIRLTNPRCTPILEFGCLNPMGIDNIAVGYDLPSPVPRPAG